MLSQEFGAAYFPVPPQDTLTDLVVTDLLEAPASVVSDVNLERIDRTDVGQAPLAKVSNSRIGSSGMGPLWGSIASV